MMKTMTKPQDDRREETQASEAEVAYEAPRITRKRSLERVTLGTGVVKPGGGVGGP
jgi:hypothetical protein